MRTIGVFAFALAFIGASLFAAATILDVAAYWFGGLRTHSKRTRDYAILFLATSIPFVIVEVFFRLFG